MTSEAGLLPLAEHAARSVDFAHIAAAPAPKRNPAPGGRKPRAPEHSTQQLLPQRVLQMIGGYPDGNDSNLLRHDPVLQMLVGKTMPGTADVTLASQPTMSRQDNGFSLHQPVSQVMSTSCPGVWSQPRNLPGFRMPRGSRAAFIFR